MTKPRISIIVAHSRNMAIGKKNALLWHLPNDLSRFKKLTMGHPMVMGRKTYESIGKPLPGRTSIVITRDGNLKIEGAIVVTSATDALERAREIEKEEIFVIGGGEIYKEILPMVDRLYVTVLDKDVDGDTFFPEYENDFIKKISEEPGGEHEGAKYYYLILER